MGYDNYDLQEVDPYLTPGSTCLQNSLGIQDTKSLNRAEAEISAAALAELIVQPVEPTFDREHLCCLNKRLFGDIYPWAGTLRESETGKGGMLFLPWRSIPEAVDEVLASLQREHLLASLGEKEFAERAAYYLGRINAIHPFREGNGRAQRVFLDQLAELAGYGFEWSAISGEQMALACNEARQEEPDYRKLIRLLQLHIVTL